MAEDIVTDIERTFLHGDKETREKWQEVIMKSEKNGYKFTCFYPHDDWQPKTEEEPPQKLALAQSESKPDELPMSHKSPTRYTPGEIEAIKQMRANPHIPDDAKPPLPEGYE